MPSAAKRSILGGRDVSVAVATQVAVSHVVDEDEDEVGPIRSEGGKPAADQGDENPIEHASRPGRGSGGEVVSA